mgnify:FL=1
MTQATEALVVDASVAVKWHLRDEEDAARATLLLHRFAQGRLNLLAPDHIRPEFAAAITKATPGRKPRLTPSQGTDAIEEFLSLGLRSFETQPLLLPAYGLAQQFGCAFYDALYLALSERLSVSLLTADERFYHAVRGHPLVVRMADYSPPDES